MYDKYPRSVHQRRRPLRPGRQLYIGHAAQRIFERERIGNILTTADAALRNSFQRPLGISVGSASGDTVRRRRETGGGLSLLYHGSHLLLGTVRDIINSA